MTSRLYYDDSLLLEFEATVTGVREHEGRTALVLDRTAFYPTSGGQPFDTGTLGGVRVVDVVDDEATGEVLHVVDGALEAGRAVHGAIDRDRRLDHMQQHTGQHVLSAAFETLYGARTVSFHLGAETATIDLDREVGPEAVAAAERRANEVIWDDRPVTVRYVSDAEAAALPLRKESKRTGTLRIVEIPDCDLSACGGTHVSRTGVIGVIAITGTERFKGGLRVTFVCGGRALGHMRRLRTAVAESVKRISVHPDELPAAIGRLQDENKQLRQTIRAQQEKLAASEAETLRAAAEPIGTARMVVAHVPGWDAGGLKLLASALAAGGGVAAALTGDGTPTPVIIVRSDDLACDAGAVLRAVTERLGGKGGGRPSLAQGAVNVPSDEARQALQDALRAALA